MRAVAPRKEPFLHYVTRHGENLSHGFLAILINFSQCLLGKVLLKTFNFITLPLLTLYITCEEMGIYQLLVGGMGIFVEVVTLGSRQYFAVEFFKHRMMYPRMQLILRNLWVYLRISSLLFFLLFLGFGWKAERMYLAVCFIVVIQSYLSMFNELYLMTLQFQMKFLRYNLTVLIFGGLQVGMVVLSVAVLEKHLLGLVFALFVGELIQLLYSTFASRRFIRVLRKIQTKENIGLRKITELVKKSIIFVPSTLSFWLLMNIDQWMLGGMVGLESVGLYAFAGKFPLLFDYLFSSSFILVYTPYFYTNLKKNFSKTGWNNVALGGVVLALSVFVYWIATKSTFLMKPIIAENYHASLAFIPPLILVACIRFATSILLLTIRFKNVIAFIMWLNVIVAGINTVLNYFWIPKYGIQGCLMATVVSFFVMFLMSLVMHVVLIRERRGLVNEG